MPGYVGTLLDIHDQDRFREYPKGVGPSQAKHGGRIVLRGPIAGVVEGKLETRQDTRLVMIEFRRSRRRMSGMTRPRTRS